MELNENNFDELIKDKKILVDFYADWCGPCKMQSQALESMNIDVDILKVNVDKHESIAKRFGIMSIPTLILFENNEIKYKNIGFTSPDEIRNWLS